MNFSPSYLWNRVFQYVAGWQKSYSEDFAADEKKKIVGSITKGLNMASFKPNRVWGEVIEDRGSQIAFSALGQQAPLEEKIK